MRCACPALVLALVHLLEPCAGAIVTTGYWPVPLARFYSAGVENSFHEKCSQPGNSDYNASEWPGWNNTGYDTGNDESTTGNTAALCKTICQDTHNAATMEYVPGDPNDSGESNYCCCAGIGFTAEEKAGPYCMYKSDKVRLLPSTLFRDSWVESYIK